MKRGVRVVHGEKELLEKLGRNDPCPGCHAATGREVFLLALDSLDTPWIIPSAQGRHFICFCAMDARNL